MTYSPRGSVCSYSCISSPRVPRRTSSCSFVSSRQRAARRASAESLREIREGLPQLVRSLVVYQRVRELRPSRLAAGGAPSYPPAGTLQTRNARCLFRISQRRRSQRCSTGRTPPGRPAHSSAEQGTPPGRKCRAFRRRLPAQRSSLRAAARGSLRFFPLRGACSSSEAAFFIPKWVSSRSVTRVSSAAI